MCPGVDSASKNGYQDIPVRKGDDLVTFMCRVSRKSGALTYQKSGITLLTCSALHIAWNPVTSSVLYNLDILFRIFRHHIELHNVQSWSI